MQCLLRFRLYQLRKCIQHIRDLVHPASSIGDECTEKSLQRADQNPSAPSPTASFGTFIPRTFRSSNTSRILPLMMPFRYNHGKNASSVRVLRTYGGINQERNVTSAPVVSSAPWDFSPSSHQYPFQSGDGAGNRFKLPDEHRFWPSYFAKKLAYFGLNRQCDQLSGSVSYQIRERVFKEFSTIK